jgi:hypothetical protein
MHHIERGGAETLQGLEALEEDLSKIVTAKGKEYCESSKSKWMNSMDRGNDNFIEDGNAV